MNEQDLYAVECGCGFCAVGSEAFVTLQAGKHSKATDCPSLHAEQVDVDSLDADPEDAEAVKEAVWDG